MKKVVLVHGWDGSPNKEWFPWLKRELEAKGFEVVAPELPNRGEPRISAWVPALRVAVSEPSADTYFVGHSMGCQAIIRYLESLPAGARVGGAVFVAGFLLPLTGLESDDERAVAREWESPIDFEKVRSHLPQSVAIFSDNDPFVPIANAEAFKANLGSEVVIEHEQGHFSEETDTTEVHIALETLLEMTA